MHLMNCRTVCEDKRNDGLGIRKFVVLNKALLGKLLWRYAHECDSPWRKIIQGKYPVGLGGRGGGGWCTLEVRIFHGFMESN